MFACPPLSFKICGDIMFVAIFPVGICGIDIIPSDVGDLAKECTTIPD
jgi:hypothetical protein